MLVELIISNPLVLLVAAAAIVVGHLYFASQGDHLPWQDFDLSDLWSAWEGHWELPFAELWECFWGSAMILGPAPCATCGDAATLRCTRCKSVRYCSKECQKVDWRAGHKEVCGKPRIRLDDEEMRERRRSLAAKLAEPYPAAEHVIFPYQKFLEILRDPADYLPEVLAAPVGLENLGNTCYANSVLQCLFATAPLAAFLNEFGRWRAQQSSEAQRKVQVKGEIAPAQPWSLLGEMSCLLEALHTSDQPISPIPLLARVNNIGRHLTFGRQEDSHDFLLTLLDAMETELLQLEGGKEAIPDVRTRETTFIFHTFGGYMRNQVHCCDCGYVSKTFESVMCLTLEIPGHVSSVTGALDLYCAEEVLDGQNKYECNCCNNKVRALKSSQIEAAPNVLALALKRFSVGRFGKLNKKVSYPETLDVADLRAIGCIDQEPQDYRLYGVVVHVDHMNSTMFGHYIAYVKASDDRWYLCDDSTVTQVSASKALSQSAYMLFYARDPENPKPEPLVRPPRPENGVMRTMGTNSEPMAAQAQEEEASAPAALRGSVLDRTNSSPAALPRMGAAGPGNVPVSVPVYSGCSTDGSDSTESAGHILQEADSVPLKESARGPQSGAAEMQNLREGPGEQMAVPAYELRQVDEPPSVHLVVYLPGLTQAESPEVHTVVDGSHNMSVAVEVPGRYLLQLMLGPGVESEEPAAKFTHKTGRLKLVFRRPQVSDSKPVESPDVQHLAEEMNGIGVSAQGQPEATAHATHSEPAARPGKGRISQQTCHQEGMPNSSSCNDLDMFASVHSMANGAS